MGERFKFLTSNYIHDDILANYSYSSQNAAYPASNLLDPFRSKVWRSNAGAFEVNSSNNILVINDGSDKTITLTIQTHTSGASLASDLQTQLNALSSGFTVAYSTTTNKFTISRSSALSILWTDASTSAAELLGYNSLVDDTGLTAYEADSARICYPAEWLKFDFGIARNPQGLVLIDNLEENIKIQPSATIKLQGNFADGWNNPEEIVLDYNVGNITTIDTSGLFTQPYRYARLHINDIDNPLGYQQLGKIYIGDVYEFPESDVQREFEESIQDLSTSQRSVGGELFHDKKSSYSRFGSVQISFCSKAEVDAVKDIWNTHRTYTPFFISIDSEAKATNNINEWTKYVRFANEPSYQTVTCSVWNIRMAFEELL